MDFPEAVKPYLPLIKGVLIAIGILIAGWIVAKWANRFTQRALGSRRLDQALARFLASIAQYTILAAAVIAALGAVDIQTTSLVAVMASAGLAIGLALQGSLASFASGVMILFFRPFTLGDKVTAGGMTGVVHDIGLFATTLVTADNETLIVPNSAVTSGSIKNFTARGTLRGAVSVSVAYGTDVARAMAVLNAAAKRAGQVLSDPAPAVALEGFGPNALQLTVYAWSMAADYLAMLHNLRTAVHEDLNLAKIAIPISPVIVQQPAA
jgi:small conductance mechanosensitive channel